MAQHAPKLQQQAQQLFDLLKKDHRQAEKMMKQFESASEEEREELFDTLNEALIEHMEMEEQEFYPVLQKISAMKEMVQDALREHKETKQFLSDLEDLDVDDEEWMPTFQEMQEGIQHHVEDEEKHIFPECKRHLSDQQFSTILKNCQQIKGEAGAAPSSKGAATGKKQTKRVGIQTG